MPLKLNVDWDHALQLYTQGLRHTQIAAILGIKVGTLTQHAKRNGWLQRKTKAHQAIQSVVQNIVMQKPKTIQKRAENWIEKTADDIERTADMLSSLPVPDSLPGLREHEEVWGMHVRRGRSVFNLDSVGRVTVNVGVNTADLRPKSEPIDVSTVQELDTPPPTE
jgi:hypothetical protein